MCISVSEVRKCSVTGAFDAPAVTDGAIANAIEQVCPLYRALGNDALQHELWGKIVALHAAHILHEGIKYEGAGGADGPVTSESFPQAGSRSYGVAAQLPDGSNWWMSSPYGKLLWRYWRAMAPAIRGVG